VAKAQIKLNLNKVLLKSNNSALFPIPNRARWLGIWTPAGILSNKPHSLLNLDKIPAACHGLRTSPNLHMFKQQYNCTDDYL
jgi:hypothetical protein